MPDANDVAKSELEAEKAKFGFNRPAAKVSDAESEDEEDQDMGDLESDEDEEVEEKPAESEEEEEEDESEESEEESDEDEESEEDESDEEEDDEGSSKKQIPFKTHNKLRKELGDVKRQLDIALKKNVEMEAKLPDDFQERIDALAKEIGVEDPESLKKIINLVKEVAVDKNVKGLEEKISKLEARVQENKAAEVVDEFPSEWKTFEDDYFSKEFPNATAEQKKSAREVMRGLAGTKDVGGKAYKHPETGKEVLDPYPLDYIFYRNRDKFEELVTGKVSKGMETARGSRIATDKGVEEIKHLPKNASAQSIRELDKKYARMEADANDGMRAPADSNI